MFERKQEKFKRKDLKEIEKTKSILKKSSLKPIDYLGGAISMRMEALEFLRDNLGDINKSIHSGKKYVSRKNYKNWF